jgi:hypothetical protein
MTTEKEPGTAERRPETKSAAARPAPAGKKDPISRKALLIASLAAAFVFVLLGGVVTKLSTPDAPPVPESTNAAAAPAPDLAVPDPAARADQREAAVRARLDEANRRLIDQQAALDEARRRLEQTTDPAVPPRAPRLERGEHEREEHRGGYDDDDDDDEDGREHAGSELRYAHARRYGHEHDDD